VACVADETLFSPSKRFQQQSANSTLFMILGERSFAVHAGFLLRLPLSQIEGKELSPGIAGPADKFSAPF
jgi:hypothetical protein